MKIHSKWLLFGNLYITQYLGAGFISVTLIAILRQNGAALSTLGFLNLIVIPYTLKFLWAPLVDKIGRKNKKGHYRSWLLNTQLLMTLMLVLAIFVNPNNNLQALLIVLFIYIFGCATQDLALDALACRIFPKEERYQINGVQMAGGMMGNIIGGGIMLILYPFIQWKGALSILALLTFLAVIQIYFYKEPVHGLDKVPSIQKPFARLIQFWRGQRRWLFAIFLYAIGFNFVFALLTPLLVDGGWTLPDIGFALKIFGSIIGAMAALTVPFLFRTLKRYTAIALALIFQGISLLFMLPLTLGYTNMLFVYMFVGLYYFSFPAVLTSVSTVMMDKSSNSATPSTDYTIQNSIFVLFSYIFSAISLGISEYIPHTYIVIFGSCLAILSGIFTRYTFKTIKHESATDKS